MTYSAACQRHSMLVLLIRINHTKSPGDTPVHIGYYWVRELTGRLSVCLDVLHNGHVTPHS